MKTPFFELHPSKPGFCEFYNFTRRPFLGLVFSDELPEEEKLFSLRNKGWSLIYFKVKPSGSDLIFINELFGLFFLNTPSLPKTVFIESSKDREGMKAVMTEVLTSFSLQFNYTFNDLEDFLSDPIYLE